MKRAFRRRIEGAFACFPVVDDAVVAVERGILKNVCIVGWAV